MVQKEELNAAKKKEGNAEEEVAGQQARAGDLRSGERKALRPQELSKSETSAVAMDDPDILHAIQTRASHGDYLQLDTEKKKPAFDNRDKPLRPKELASSEISKAAMDDPDVLDAIKARASPDEDTKREGQQQHQVVETTSLGETPPEPPLARKRPGAYAAAPGVSLERLPNLSFSRIGSPTTEREPVEEATTISVSAPQRNQISYQVISPGSLCQALPVEDEPVHDMQAQPIDVEAARGRTNNNNFLRNKIIILIAVAIGVVPIALAVGLVYRRKNNHSSTSMPSLPPTTLTTLNLTISPIEDDSRMQTFRASLPNYTLASLQDPFSPQSLAYEWLNDHSNITFMQDWRIAQLFALATLYHAWDGPNWPSGLAKDWLDYTRSECFWFSATADIFYPSFSSNGKFEGRQNNETCNSNGEFTKLSLGNSFINVTHIPMEIAFLSNLQEIYLNQANLNTTLDKVLPALELLPSLRVISLENNPIYGTLPSELALLSQLEQFYLASPYLSGPMPSEVFASWSHLEIFYLEGTFVTGTIPTTIGALSSVDTFMLWGTQVTGIIPTEIGALSNLMLLFLFETLLTGSIPTEITALPKLDFLYLEYCSLSGKLPTEIGLMSKLSFLGLGLNYLTGTLPTELAMSSLLADITLYGNLLRGAIPTELGTMTALTWLDLSYNEFTDSIPSEIGMDSNLIILNLNDNFLSGNIPTQLGLLEQLLELNLANNTLLSGQVPDPLCRLNQPNCTVDGAWWWEDEASDACSLFLFDCTDILCGCDCPCSDIILSNATNSSRK